MIVMDQVKGEVWYSYHIHMHVMDCQLVEMKW